jgi:thymidylate kinase
VTRRIAIVGIDGAGKTSVVRSLEDGLDGGDSVAAVYCPLYHDIANGPLHTLSRQLQALSAVADDLDWPGLKATALYLQLSLYGPVERFMIETFRPPFLVSDRHALVDALVYGPFYERMVDESAASGERARLLRDALEARMPGAYDGVNEWLRAENRRLGLADELAPLMRELRACLAQPPEEFEADLKRRFRTTLPHAIVLLDVDPSEARRRLSGRTQSRGFHETAAALAVLRERYRATLADLDGRKGVVVREVATDGRSLETVTAAVADAGGIRVGAATT